MAESNQPSKRKKVEAAFFKILCCGYYYPFHTVYYNVSRYSDYFQSNMAYFKCSLRILHYMILSLISLVFAKDDLVLKDDLLTNHVFLTIYTDDWLNSVQVCLDEPRCIAYNFKINHGPCELVESGLQDICHRYDSLIYSRGFVFQQLRTIRKVKSLSEL